MTSTLPAALCQGVLDTLVERGRLTEATGPDGGPTIELTSEAFGNVGEARIFHGDSIAKVVYVGIVVPQIGMDSHMVFAFAPENTPVPHFTLDSVHAGGHFAFHLDLIQRVDVATHMVYNDWAHTPLTETFEQVLAMEALTKADLQPRQLSVMSPWMLASRITEEAFPTLDAPVRAYLEHWFSLVENAVPAEVTADVADTDLPVRDAKNRSLLFSRDVDKVWAQIERLLGPDQTEAVRLLLVDNEIPA
jgi:hypothetical protein